MISNPVLKFLYKHRFLLSRRIVQVSILFLYFAGNAFGWTLLRGNLSTSLFMEKIPFADPYAVLQMFAAGALLSIDVMIGAFLILFFYAVIGGRAFCSWVCPINMVTDLANWIRKKLKLDKDEWQLRFSRKTRYWILGLSLILSFIISVPVFEFISPISMFHRGIVFGMGLGWTAVLGVFLFELFVTKNGWCGHLCPLGAFYSLVTSKSAIRVYHYQPNCTLCMNCKNICPEKQVLPMVGKENGFVISGECINCGRCIEVCNDDALQFAVRFLPPKGKEKMPAEANTN